ncbi:hypothetical protein L218DRAFT_1056550 [Marasmius fiardii PR-910]|nr:hypothetical protein L218DRAFT_1056550 [Marasmius fiardii PR-910]
MIYNPGEGTCNDPLSLTFSFDMTGPRVFYAGTGMWPSPIAKSDPPDPDVCENSPNWPKYVPKMAKIREYPGLDITYAPSSCDKLPSKAMETGFAPFSESAYRKLSVYNSGNFQAEFGIKSLKNTAKVAKKTVQSAGNATGIEVKFVWQLKRPEKNYEGKILRTVLGCDRSPSILKLNNIGGSFHTAATGSCWQDIELAVSFPHEGDETRFEAMAAKRESRSQSLRSIQTSTMSKQSASDTTQDGSVEKQAAEVRAVVDPDLAEVKEWSSDDPAYNESEPNLEKFQKQNERIRELLNGQLRAFEDGQTKVYQERDKLAVENATLKSESERIKQEAVATENEWKKRFQKLEYEMREMKRENGVMKKKLNEWREVKRENEGMKGKLNSLKVLQRDLDRLRSSMNNVLYKEEASAKETPPSLFGSGFFQKAFMDGLGSDPLKSSSATSGFGSQRPGQGPYNFEMPRSDFGAKQNKEFSFGDASSSEPPKSSSGASGFFSQRLGQGPYVFETEPSFNFAKKNGEFGFGDQSTAFSFDNPKNNPQEGCKPM